MVKILHISANTNSFHKNRQKEHVFQVTSDDILYKKIFLTDNNFPPRINAMNPRLQSKMPRMLAYDMYPGYDYYFWTDSNITLRRPDTIMNFFELCSGKDMVLFSHPFRKLLREEFKFMFENTKISFLEKYKNELIQEQYRVYKNLKTFKTIPLFASGCFMYKNNEKTRAIMKEWFFQNCRYSTQCQLSLPYVVDSFKPSYTVLSDNIVDNDYLKYWGYED
jgi:hypothetical protein